MACSGTAEILFVPASIGTPFRLLIPALGLFMNLERLRSGSRRIVHGSRLDPE